MSLFGAKKTSTFGRALERAKKAGREKSSEDGISIDESASSGIGAQMTIASELQKDPDGTATTSEIAREELYDQEGEVQQAAVTLPREVFNQGVRINNAEVRAAGHPSQMMEPVFGTAPCDAYGNGRSQQHDVHTISSDDSTLSSPPVTSCGGSNISFPSQTPGEVLPPTTTSYGGSIVAMPPSALPLDPFSTPRADAGIIAQM